MDTSATICGLTRRTFTSSCGVVTLLASLGLAGACSTPPANSEAALTGSAAATGTGISPPVGTPSAGGPVGMGTSPAGTSSPTPSGGATSAPSPTGVVTPGGSVSVAPPASGGPTPPSSTTTPVTSSSAPPPEPCEDLEPPADPEWPDATCAKWATESEECGADWFKDYCDISCGRCVPEGGPGPSASMSVPEPVCEDKLPPDDPEWPGATCAEWAAESEECGADWFKDYCAISCGRCIPEGGLPEPPSGPDCSGENLPAVMGGNGFATRYWDCCQPHCSQFNGHRCGQDGTSGTGDTTSACNGGGSFACYDEAPRAVSDCLSYGHIAKSNPNCGACYRIEFTGQGEHNASDPGSQLIKGKQMIVKVTNTGGDVAGNQFDLMIPGGGVGMFNACSRQWGSNDLGAQYGGFLTQCSGSHEAKKECVRQECMKIPAGSARDGCLWFVDWLQVADNPKFTSQETSCPF
jgi:Glycosyl hydrolase family 45/ShK domain-like